MQWYEIMSKKICNVYKIDRKLVFIRLRWYRTAETSKFFSSSREYTLISAEGIKEVVHVVGKISEHSHFHPNACRGFPTCTM